MGSCEKDDSEPEPAPTKEHGKIVEMSERSYLGKGFLIDQSRSEYNFSYNTLDLYTTDGLHFKIRFLGVEAGRHSTPVQNYTCSGASWGDFKTRDNVNPVISLNKETDIFHIRQINLYSEAGSSLVIKGISFYKLR